MTDRSVIVVAGPNGSGKTTFALEFLVGQDLPYLSADRIADQLGAETLDEVRIRAGRLFFARAVEQIDRRELPNRIHPLWHDLPADYPPPQRVTLLDQCCLHLPWLTGDLHCSGSREGPEGRTPCRRRGHHSPLL